jgi:hypothetical protein
MLSSSIQQVFRFQRFSQKLKAVLAEIDIALMLGAVACGRLLGKGVGATDRG